MSGRMSVFSELKQASLLYTPKDDWYGKSPKREVFLEKLQKVTKEIFEGIEKSFAFDEQYFIMARGYLDEKITPLGKGVDSIPYKYFQVISDELVGELKKVQNEILTTKEMIDVSPYLEHFFQLYCESSKTLRCASNTTLFMVLMDQVMERVERYTADLLDPTVMQCAPLLCVEELLLQEDWKQNCPKVFSENTSLQSFALSEFAKRCGIENPLDLTYEEICEALLGQVEGLEEEFPEYFSLLKGKKRMKFSLFLLKKLGLFKSKKIRSCEKKEMQKALVLDYLSKLHLQIKKLTTDERELLDSQLVSGITQKNIELKGKLHEIHREISEIGSFISRGKPAELFNYVLQVIAIGRSQGFKIL